MTYYNKTKIIASLGPTSLNYQSMLEMAQAGVDAFRLNFSHASKVDFLNASYHIKKLNRDLKTHIGLMIDTEGPEIRTGYLKEALFLKKDSLVFLNDLKIKPELILKELNNGDIILLDDGLVKIEVVDSLKLIGKVLTEGVVTSKRGVNILDKDLNQFIFSNKDIEYLKFLKEHNLEVDYIALSFVSSFNDVVLAKELLKSINLNPLVISKIECLRSCKDIENILKMSDGIMIARGDLGTEVEIYKLPMIQNKLIEEARKLGKLTIVATEMLSSMKTNIRPTRAESSDIYNAVLEGADVLMLSDETTIGKFPVEAVKFLSHTAKFSEEVVKDKFELASSLTSYGMLKGLYEIVKAESFKYIVVFSKKEEPFKLISSLHLKTKVIGVVEEKELAKKLNLCYGLELFYMPYFYKDKVLQEKFKKHLKKEDEKILLVYGNESKISKIELL